MSLLGRNAPESSGTQETAGPPPTLPGRLAVAGDVGELALTPDIVSDGVEGTEGAKDAPQPRRSDASLPGRLAPGPTVPLEQNHQLPPPTLPGRLGNPPPGAAG